MVRDDGRRVVYYRRGQLAQRPSAAAAGEPGGVLVTGGAGYVGSALVHHLHRQGVRVTVLDDLSTGHAEDLPDGVELVVAQVGDVVAVRELFARRRFQAVFHFAASSLVGESLRQPLAYYRNNVRQGLALIEEVVRAGCPPFILSSSAAVYGVPERVPIPEQAPSSPVNPYGETKRVLEAALRWAGAAHGLPWMALRYFNAAGAYQPWGPVERHEPETHLIPNLLRAAAGGEPLVVHGDDYPTPDGTAVRDYVHVADLAEGHLAAWRHLEAGGACGPVNLGSGRGYSVREVIAVAERVLGRPVPHRLGPRRAGDPPILVADIAQARQVLGWSPQHSDLEEIVDSARRASEGPGRA